MKRYQIKAIGCKVNQYEAQQISEFLQNLGLRACEPSKPADLAIVHSCAVTSRAMAKSRQALSRFLRQNTPIVVLSGCGARWAKTELAKLGPTVKLIPEAQDIARVLSNIVTEQAAPNDASSAINQGSKATSRNEQCMIPAPVMATVAASNPLSPLSNHIQTNCSRQVKGEICSAGFSSNDGSIIQAASMGPITCFSRHQRAFVKV